MLLTEYGFTLGTNPFNNVDIDRHIAELFNELGEEGSIKRGLLQDNGYWACVNSLHPLPTLPTLTRELFA